MTKEEPTFSGVFALRDAINEMLCRSKSLVQLSKSLKIALEDGGMPSNDDYRVAYSGGGKCRADIDPELGFLRKSLEYWWAAKMAVDEAGGTFDWTLVNDDSRPQVDRWQSRFLRLLSDYTKPLQGTYCHRHRIFNSKVDLPLLIQRVFAGDFPPPDWPDLESKLIAAAREIDALTLVDATNARSRNTRAPSGQKKRGKRGRRSDTDHAEDSRISQAWKSGHFHTYDQLAKELGGNLTARSVRLAVDRDRKRGERNSSGDSAPDEKDVR